MHMKKMDPDYARESLREHDKAMPWLELVEGVRDAITAESSRAGAHLGGE